MFSLTLFKREMKANIKLLTIFIYILTLYIFMIVYMFNPSSGTGWDAIIKLMPGCNEGCWVYMLGEIHLLGL